MSREAELGRLAAAAARWAYVRADRWSPVPPELDEAIARDQELAEAARAARRGLLDDVARRLEGLLPEELDPRTVTRTVTTARAYGALLEVPRERFVLPEDIASSAADAPSPLDMWGLATVSAPHAYLLSYALLGLEEGDHLLELGSGTGYGAALARHIVGPRGRVTSIEIDPDLHARAARLLAAPEVPEQAELSALAPPRPADPSAPAPPRLALLLGDARALAPSLMTGPEPLRVAVTYAIAEPPEALLARLPPGGRIVAPVGRRRLEEEQTLERWERDDRGALRGSTHGAVRYVVERR
jgi:protein-L-isoaspartate(D-aspartate) O-methyltransferase